MGRDLGSGRRCWRRPQPSPGPRRCVPGGAPMRRRSTDVASHRRPDDEILILFVRARAELDDMVDRRWLLGCVGVWQPDPTGDSPASTTRLPNRNDEISGAREGFAAPSLHHHRGRASGRPSPIAGRRTRLYCQARTGWKMRRSPGWSSKDKPVRGLRPSIANDRL